MAEAPIKKDKYTGELDKLTRMLVGRDLELAALKEKRDQEIKEMDRIAKMLVRRDFELSETREKREATLKKLEKRTKELEEARAALINILEDVEEARRKAEEEKNKTLAIISNFTDGLLVFDFENHLSFINPPVEVFFTAAAEQFIGKSLLDLKKIFQLKPLINFLEKEGKEISRKELEVRQGLVLEISSIPIMLEGGKTGTLVILHDVTREKMVERMKTEFVSVAAHQLRTPLSAIKWTLKMLLEGDLGQLSSEQRDFIGKTYKSNERMINLINDLLDVTRIDEGRYLFKPVLTDIDPLIQSVINSYKEEFEKKKIKLQLKREDKKLPKVLVDVEKMSLAFQNLVDNALKYTQSGGTITISLKKEEKEIKISVKDTGVGIPKDQQIRVFNKFFRGANVMRMETEGSGLGLFIAKNIIEAHGGRIWFKSDESRGTIFWFTLPAKKEFEEFLKKV